jgi:glucokinase
MNSGADAPTQHWRARFTAPPILDELTRRIGDGLRALKGSRNAQALGVAIWDAKPPEPGSSRLVGVDAAELSSLLAEQLGAPVRFQDAVASAAQAEARQGAAQGVDPIVYVHLGREVRAAIISQGATVHGANGQVGQIGHWRVAENGPRCACGQIGHLNPLCSSQGFVRLAIGAVSQDDNALAAATRVTGARVETLTAQQIVTLAKEHITPLERRVAESADALSVALTDLALLIDPAMIVLGGPLGVAGGSFLTQVQENVAAQLRAVAQDWSIPTIVPARLEPQSALIGAWLLAHEDDGLEQPHA